MIRPLINIVGTIMLASATLFAEGAPRREGLTQSIREAIIHKDDAAVSLLAANWRGNKAANSLPLCEDGLPCLMALSAAIADCGVAVDREYNMASEFLQRWMEHEPKNTIPMILRACQLAERAPAVTDLKAREKMMQTMVELIESAEQLTGRTADWYLGYIQVITRVMKQAPKKEIQVVTKLPKDQVKQIFEDGVRKFPDYAVLYFATSRLDDIAKNKFSESVGFPSDLNEFALYVCSLVPERGLEPYTRLWWSMGDYGQELFTPGKCDWPSFRSGFETMMQRVPDSKRNLSYFLRFARIAHDKITARKLLDQIGGKPDPQVYAVESRFLEVSAWANDEEPYGQMRWSVPGKSVKGIAWAPDGKTIYMGQWGNGITLVDSATGQTKGSFLIGESSNAEGKEYKMPLLASDISVSQDGNLIAAAFGFRRDKNPCCVWDRDGNVVKLFYSKAGPFLRVKFNEQNELLVVGGNENDPAEVWQWAPGEEPLRLNIFDRHRHSIGCVAWLPDNGRLVNCSGGQLSYWNGVKESTWKQAAVPENFVVAQDISVSPDKQWVAVALGGNLNGSNENKPIGAVTIFDSRTGNVRKGNLSPLIGTLTTLAYSPDGRFIATGGVDGFIYFMNAETLEIKHWWNMEVGSIKRVSWSPDGRKLAVTSSNPHRLWLWELK